MSEDCHNSNNVAAELDSAGDSLTQIAFMQFSDDEIFREANRRRGIHPAPRLPSPGCHCQPGRCMAPKIAGTQTPCRDPEKANRAAPPNHEAQVPEFEYSDCTQEDAVYGEKFASDVIKLGYNGDIRDAISVTRAVQHRYKRQLAELLAQNAALTSEVEIVTANRDGWKHMTEALRERRDFLLVERVERITENKRLQSENARMKDLLRAIKTELNTDHGIVSLISERDIESFLTHL